MANRSTELGRVNRESPERAARMLRVALTVAGGNVAKAARALDVSEDQLRRYVRRLGLESHLEELRAAS